jgi:molecular chaperone DnaK (HSP70)
MILKKRRIDLSSDIQALQRLTEAAEKAKIESTVEKQLFITIYYC